MSASGKSTSVPTTYMGPGPDDEANGLDVARQPAQQIAGPRAVEERDREVLHVREEVSLQVALDVARRADQQEALRPGQEAGGGTHAQERPRRARRDGDRLGAATLQDVQRAAQEERGVDEKEPTPQHAQGARRERRPVPREVAENPAIGGLAGHPALPRAAPDRGRRRVSLRPYERPTQGRSGSVRPCTRGAHAANALGADRLARHLRCIP